MLSCCVRYWSRTVCSGETDKGKAGAEGRGGGPAPSDSKRFKQEAGTGQVAPQPSSSLRAPTAAASKAQKTKLPREKKESCCLKSSSSSNQNLQAHSEGGHPPKAPVAPSASTSQSPKSPRSPKSSLFSRLLHRQSSTETETPRQARPARSPSGPQAAAEPRISKLRGSAEGRLKFFHRTSSLKDVKIPVPIAAKSVAAKKPTSGPKAQQERPASRASYPTRPSTTTTGQSLTAPTTTRSRIFQISHSHRKKRQEKMAMAEGPEAQDMQTQQGECGRGDGEGGSAPRPATDSAQGEDVEMEQEETAKKTGVAKTTRDSVQAWVDSISDSRNDGAEELDRRGAAAAAAASTADEATDAVAMDMALCDEAASSAAKPEDDDLTLGAEAKLLTPPKDAVLSRATRQRLAEAGASAGKSRQLAWREMYGQSHHESFNSDGSALSFRTMDSIEQLLQDRIGDPEEILANLGFHSHQSDDSLSSRIPERFLRHQSNANGVSVEKFIDNNPELRDYWTLTRSLSEHSHGSIGSDSPKWNCGQGRTTPVLYNVARTLAIAQQFSGMLSWKPSKHNRKMPSLDESMGMPYIGVLPNGKQYASILHPDNSAFLAEQGIYDAVAITMSSQPEAATQTRRKSSHGSSLIRPTKHSLTETETAAVDDIDNAEASLPPKKSRLSDILSPAPIEAVASPMSLRPAVRRYYDFPSRGNVPARFFMQPSPGLIGSSPIEDVQKEEEEEKKQDVELLESDQGPRSRKLRRSISLEEGEELWTAAVECDTSDGGNEDYSSLPPTSVWKTMVGEQRREAFHTESSTSEEHGLRRSTSCPGTDGPVRDGRWKRTRKKAVMHSETEHKQFLASLLTRADSRKDDVFTPDATSSPLNDLWKAPTHSEQASDFYCDKSCDNDRHIPLDVPDMTDNDVESGRGEDPWRISFEIGDDCDENRRTDVSIDCVDDVGRSDVNIDSGDDVGRSDVSIDCRDDVERPDVSIDCGDDVGRSDVSIDCRDDVGRSDVSIDYIDDVGRSDVNIDSGDNLGRSDVSIDYGDDVERSDVSIDYVDDVGRSDVSIDCSVDEMRRSDVSADFSGDVCDAEVEVGTAKLVAIEATRVLMGENPNAGGVEKSAAEKEEEKEEVGKEADWEPIKDINDNTKFTRSCLPENDVCQYLPVLSHEQGNVDGNPSDFECSTSPTPLDLEVDRDLQVGVDIESYGSADHVMPLDGPTEHVDWSDGLEVTLTSSVSESSQKNRDDLLSFDPDAASRAGREICDVFGHGNVVMTSLKSADDVSVLHSTGDTGYLDGPIPAVSCDSNVEVCHNQGVFGGGGEVQDVHSLSDSNEETGDVRFNGDNCDANLPSETRDICINVNATSSEIVDFEMLKNELSTVISAPESGEIIYERSTSMTEKRKRFSRQNSIDPSGDTAEASQEDQGSVGSGQEDFRSSQVSVGSGQEDFRSSQVSVGSGQEDLRSSQVSVGSGQEDFRSSQVSVGSGQEDTRSGEVSVGSGQDIVRLGQWDSRSDEGSVRSGQWDSRSGQDSLGSCQEDSRSGQIRLGSCDEDSEAGQLSLEVGENSRSSQVGLGSCEEDSYAGQRSVEVIQENSRSDQSSMISVQGQGHCKSRLDEVSLGACTDGFGSGEGSKISDQCDSSLYQGEGKDILSYDSELLYTRSSHPGAMTADQTNGDEDSQRKESTESNISLEGWEVVPQENMGYCDIEQELTQDGGELRRLSLVRYTERQPDLTRQPDEATNVFHCDVIEDSVHDRSLQDSSYLCDVYNQLQRNAQSQESDTAQVSLDLPDSASAVDRLQEAAVWDECHPNHTDLRSNRGGSLREMGSLPSFELEEVPCAEPEADDPSTNRGPVDDTSIHRKSRPFVRTGSTQSDSSGFVDGDSMEVAAPGDMEGQLLKVSQLGSIEETDAACTTRISEVINTDDNQQQDTQQQAPQQQDLQERSLQQQEHAPEAVMGAASSVSLADLMTPERSRGQQTTVKSGLQSPVDQWAVVENGKEITHKDFLFGVPRETPPPGGAASRKKQSSQSQSRSNGRSPHEEARLPLSWISRMYVDPPQRARIVPNSAVKVSLVIDKGQIEEIENATALGSYQGEEGEIFLSGPRRVSFLHLCVCEQGQAVEIRPVEKGDYLLPAVEVQAVENADYHLLPAVEKGDYHLLPAGSPSDDLRQHQVLCALLKQPTDAWTLDQDIQVRDFSKPGLETLQHQRVWTVDAIRHRLQRHQHLLEEVKLIQHALAKFKIEFRSLDLKTKDIYHRDFGTLTEEQKQELEELKILRTEVSKEITELEHNLADRMGTLSVSMETDDLTNMAGLSVISEMIHLLKEQVFHSNVIGTLGLAAAVDASERPLHVEPANSSSDSGHQRAADSSSLGTEDQLTVLQRQLAEQQAQTTAQLSLSLRELKDALLSEVRQTVHEETQELRKQVAAAETQVSALMKKLYEQEAPSAQTDAGHG